MSADWVRANYGVDYKRGDRLRVDGRPGVLVSFPGQYLGVRFDGDTRTTRCHPTWRVDRIPTEVAVGERPTRTLSGTPRRIQRRRVRGWTMPAEAVYVGRPTLWGNVFRALRVDGEWQVVATDTGTRYPVPANTRRAALERAIEMYRIDLIQWSEQRMRLPELRGHDLVCWCPLTDAAGQHVPCHADVLLEFANHSTGEESPACPNRH